MWRPCWTFNSLAEHQYGCRCKGNTEASVACDWHAGAFPRHGNSNCTELNSTIKDCRVKHIHVIFTQYGHKHVELDSGVLEKFWGHGNLIQYKSQDWKQFPKLCIDVKDVIIDEIWRYDAFFGTILEEILHQLGIDAVVISGMMTNLCCETTARLAFVRGFDVIFLSNGTTTSSKSMHNATLKNVAYGFAKVMYDMCQVSRQNPMIASLIHWDSNFFQFNMQLVWSTTTFSCTHGIFNEA